VGKRLQPVDKPVFPVDYPVHRLAIKLPELFWKSIRQGVYIRRPEFG
jgi:hypothetical protein